MNSTIFYIMAIIVILFLYRDAFKKKKAVEPEIKELFNGDSWACDKCKNRPLAVENGVCDRGEKRGFISCGELSE